MESPDAPRIKRIDENCKLLYEGYYDKVEYDLGVAVHAADCQHYRKSSKPKDCPCPVTYEKRVRNVRRLGLLDQLRQFAANKDTDRNAKAERGAPRVKTAGKPPGDLAGFFALDELSCDIVAVVDRALIESGRNRDYAVQPLNLILIGLAGQAAYMLDGGRPDLVRDLDLASTRWVDSARSTLKITVGDSMFDAVTCGNCGGALATPYGNRGDADVRCIGTPDAPPCGETYPPGEWLRLYEDHQRRQGS